MKIWKRKCWVGRSIFYLREPTVNIEPGSEPQVNLSSGLGLYKIGEHKIAAILIKFHWSVDFEAKKSQV